MNMRIATWMCCGAIALSLMSAAARGDSIVVPNGFENVNADSGNFFPFGITTGFQPMRYQQVYAADQFGPGGLIAGIAFRRDFNPLDPADVPFSVTLSGVQISMSTIAAGPDALSGTFASNVGPDVQSVLSGSLVMTSTDTSLVGPRPFELGIVFDTPFNYDSSAGNLLLDVLVTSTSNTSGVHLFNLTTSTTDSISRVYRIGSTGGTGSVSSYGLVTRFDIVPEPTSMALRGVAVLGALARPLNSRISLSPADVLPPQ